MQKLAMILIVAVFVYIFYYYYGMFTGYRAVKKGAEQGQRKVERGPIPIAPPSFFTFIPGDEENPDIEKFRLFTFKEKKAKAGKPGFQGPMDSNPTKVENYLVLGVVKKDKLFVVVQFKSDNKIRLFAEGTAINGNSRVKRVTPRQVVISGPSGGERSHKIFRFEGVKEIDVEKMKKKMKKKKREEEENDRKPKMGAKDNVDDN